jgi:hypothetical protein
LRCLAIGFNESFATVKPRAKAELAEQSPRLLAGGFRRYNAEANRVIGTAFHANSIHCGAPAIVHLRMIERLSVWLLVLALVPFLVVMVFTVRFTRTQLNLRRLRLAFSVIAAWIVVPFFFYATIYYLKPGYQLI